MAAVDTLFHPRRYPWPYCDPQFPGFEEDDDALIGDAAGFVIRRSPSYVVWQTWRVTGKALRKHHKSHCHAKDWGKFLESYGYQQVDMCNRVGSCFVGVAPDEGEFGQLYWYEEKSPSLNADNQSLGYVCSTYRNFREVREWVDSNRQDVFWYKIC